MLHRHDEDFLLVGDEVDPLHVAIKVLVHSSRAGEVGVVLQELAALANSNSVLVNVDQVPPIELVLVGVLVDYLVNVIGFARGHNCGICRGNKIFK